MAIASTDAEFYDAIVLTCFIFVSPVLFIVGGIILYLYIGPSGLIAIVIMIIYLLILQYSTIYMKRIRIDIGSNTDQKLKTLNSLIEAIRVVKMYAWEMRFRDLIKEFRD